MSFYFSSTVYDFLFRGVNIVTVWGKCCLMIINLFDVLFLKNTVDFHICIIFLTLLMVCEKPFLLISRNVTSFVHSRMIHANSPPDPRMMPLYPTFFHIYSFLEYKLPYFVLYHLLCLFHQVIIQNCVFAARFPCPLFSYNHTTLSNSPLIYYRGG